MTAALYVRTSTDDNDGSAQLHELREWAARQGSRDWFHATAYIDKGESGAKASRPQWDKLLADVRAGRVRELACTELSRMGRSVLNVVLALDELHAAGCRVVLLRQGLDYGTPIGRAVATILAAVAQLEREQIRERIAAGVRRAREKGSRSGKPIGRPRAVVTGEQLERARQARARGDSWSDVAWQVNVPASTIRRAVEACQNPA
jgi:DNA invertase Pin-like site-specific DNA recombinase